MNIQEFDKLFGTQQTSNVNERFTGGIKESSVVPSDPINDGEGRHAALVRYAGFLRGLGQSSDDILIGLRVFNERWISPPKDETDLAHIASTAENWPIGPNAVPGTAMVAALPTQVQERNDYELTDWGNASRLIDRFKDVLRTDRQSGAWLLWKGKRWVMETNEKRAKQLISELVPEIITATFSEEIARAATKDPAMAAALNKHRLASQSGNKVAQLINTVYTRGMELHTPLSEWDGPATRSLLTVDNGTINLRTGELREHRKEDRMSKRIYLAYDPSATCPRWLSVLHEIFGGNEALIDYVQRACGYCLTGETGEQVCFFLHGEGRNGKSTFVDIIRQILGPHYAKSIPTKAVMRHRNTSASSHSEDIAGLRGARFAFAQETNIGENLNESLIKQMTGQDAITARHIFGGNFTFSPTAKFWLICNHKPRIAGVDAAIWRRIRLIPFTVKIENVDLEIHKTLSRELPGILSWCVQGAIRYYKEGLHAPEEVLAATDEYREDEDTIAGFFNDRCELQPDKTVTPSSLYGNYELWCKENGENALSNRSFVAALKLKGFKQSRTNSQRMWLGIGMRPLSPMGMTG